MQIALKENSLFYTLEDMRSLMPFHVGNVSVLVDNNSHLESSKNYTISYLLNQIYCYVFISSLLCPGIWKLVPDSRQVCAGGQGSHVISPSSCIHNVNQCKVQAKQLFMALYTLSVSRLKAHMDCIHKKTQERGL